MPRPKDTALYAKVRLLANKKFAIKTSAYKSAWAVTEYKRRGGKYIGKKTTSRLVAAIVQRKKKLTKKRKTPTKKSGAKGSIGRAKK